MSEHISSNEFRQYFDILLSGMPDEEDADFVNDIDAHIAGCDQCMKKMQAIRILMQGFSSSPDLAKTLINKEFPETLAKPAFDIRKVFMGVKLKMDKTAARMASGAAGEITQVLADAVSDKMNAAFVPRRSMLAAARGNDEVSMDGGVINDLLCSDMEFPMEDGRKITIRCREAGLTDRVRLFVYSNFEVGFKLASDGKELEPVGRDHDIAADEYILVYELDGGEEFLLTVE